MTDSVLSARLDALEQSLNDAPQHYRDLWHCMQPDGSLLHLIEAATRDLNEEIDKQTIEWLDSLQSGRDKLQEAAQAESAGAGRDKLKEAWQRYTEVYRESQAFFTECVEIMGGLTFRAAGMQDTIYRLADELTYRCAKLSGPGWVGPTAPLQSKTLLKTLARIIGLPFPRWTIWDLPLTAHELGHVVVEADERLRISSDAQAQEWSNGSAWRQIVSYVYEADAFAISVMGPAYACAVVLLSLNPLTAYLDREGYPADAKRAYVIFSMLGRMSHQGNKAYDFQLSQLQDEWKSMLTQLGQPEQLERQDVEHLDELVDAIEEALDRRLFRIHRDAKYRHDKGWELAKEWEERWRTVLDKGATALSIEDMRIPEDSGLRDVLNAAWLCRLKRPGKIAEIAVAARQMCEAVKTKTEERERRAKFRRGIR